MGPWRLAASVLPLKIRFARGRFDDVLAKSAIIASLAAVAALALAAAPTRADDSAPPATAAASCLECCEGNAVCQALAGLADLQDTVSVLVPQRGTANSLLAKLDAATSSVLDLRVTSALNQLDAFAHEVDAIEASGRTTEAVSNIMKTKHDTVKNSISNIR
jgi:hypothetical protein